MRESKFKKEESSQMAAKHISWKKKRYGKQNIPT